MKQFLLEFERSLRKQNWYNLSINYPVVAIFRALGGIKSSVLLPFINELLENVVFYALNRFFQPKKLSWIRSQAQKKSLIARRNLQQAVILLALFATNIVQRR